MLEVRYNIERIRGILLRNRGNRKGQREQSCIDGIGNAKDAIK